MWGRKGRRSQHSDISYTMLSASIVVTKGVFAAQDTQQKPHKVFTRVQEEQHPLGHCGGKQLTYTAVANSGGLVTCVRIPLPSQSLSG